MISAELSRWLADIAQTCDHRERQMLASATMDIFEQSSEEDPIKSIYDDRVPKDAQKFVLELAARAKLAGVHR